MLNEREIIAAADAETVAEYLQMEIVQKGRYRYIRCPGHKTRTGREDEHIGNAVLRHGGYMCYACGRFVPTMEMVEEYTGCDSREALRIMASAMGLTGAETDGEAEACGTFPKYRLSRQEAGIIGLYPQMKDNHVVPDANGEWVMDGLYNLYEKDSEQYYRIVAEKAEAAKKKYEWLLKHCASRTADKAYLVYDLLGDGFDSSVYSTLQVELTSRVETCGKLMNWFRKELERIRAGRPQR